MPLVWSWLNKEEIKLLEKQCATLDETIYQYTQKAIRERMRRNQTETLSEKANRILWGEHK